MKISKVSSIGDKHKRLAYEINRRCKKLDIVTRHVVVGICQLLLFSWKFVEKDCDL
jgi:hypothetical protein